MLPSLAKIRPGSGHVFIEPAKRIRFAQDIDTFLCSRAYADITTFLQQLNRAMVPCKFKNENGVTKTKTWELTSKDIVLSEPVRNLRELLGKLETIVEEAPPSTGPRRFGNIAFRDWHARVEERLPELFSNLISIRLNAAFLEKTGEDNANAETELHKYLKGSFGSAQRLDYGTGHELSFLAFLAALWKLNYFEEQEYGVEERGIVVGVIEPYMRLMRRLIGTYTLEPAGSHGVWGLDDHFFLPYIFGSAQLCPAVTGEQLTPVEGSMARAPKPSSITNKDSVEMWKDMNMYFSAVWFICDVKKGPFWEHSPVLFDVSGIKDGWGKINKGMIKMHNAEVLSKFPVVQHFPIGSLFRLEKDPNIPVPATNTHVPQSQFPGVNKAHAPLSSPKPFAKAPSTSSSPMTAAPWETQAPRPSHSAAAGMPITAAPWATRSQRPSSTEAQNMPMTAAPWATQTLRTDPQMLSRANLRSVYPPASGASEKVDTTVSRIDRLNLEKKNENAQSNLDDHEEAGGEQR
ncbi:Serine/threonine-protein phosphatase 2A activator 1 [Ascosphaera aggregata]|nr:Serine/threonine-protein phosphatase 2A activator 1 [Ascosphaera aggregata]